MQIVEDLQMFVLTFVVNGYHKLIFQKNIMIILSILMGFNNMCYLNYKLWLMIKKFNFMNILILKKKKNFI